MSFSPLHAYLNSNRQTKLKYLTLESSRSEQIDNVINRGFKTWVRVESANVVIPTDTHEYKWLDNIEAEMALASYLSKNGLFTLPIKKETILFKELKLPAYSYPPLRRLEQEGCYLIDLRQDKNSSWKLQKKSLFLNPTDKYFEGKWLLALAPLVQDIARLLVLGMPLDLKNLCLAIVKTDKGFIVRYLAIDLFAHPKEIIESISDINPLTWNEPVKIALETIIKALIGCEFQTFGLKENQIALMQKLVENFISVFFLQTTMIYLER
ncbi:MAG: hypothetical protein ACK4HV_08885, partial [Parachlamydiaceae bacterium]